MVVVCVQQIPMLVFHRFAAYNNFRRTGAAAHQCQELQQLMSFSTGSSYEYRTSSEGSKGSLAPVEPEVEQEAQSKFDEKSTHVDT